MLKVLFVNRVNGLMSNESEFDSELFPEYLRHTDSIIFVLDSQNRIVRASKLAEAIDQHSAASTASKFTDLISSSQDCRRYLAWKDSGFTLLAPTLAVGETSKRMECSAFSCETSLGTFSFLTLHDSEGQSAREKQLSRLAVTDPLTGLFNRRAFQTQLESLAGSPIVVAIYDIDYFKLVNDNYGHPAGDETINQIAQVLKNMLNDFVVARLGGDEFGAVAKTGDATIVQLEERFTSTLQQIASLPQSNDATVTVSAGIAIDTTGQHPVREMLSMADAALYESKRAGRNRVTVRQLS